MTEQQMKDKAMSLAIERLKVMYTKTRIKNREDAIREAAVMRTLTGIDYIADARRDKFDRIYYMVIDNKWKQTGTKP